MYGNFWALLMPDAASIFVVFVGVHHTLPHIFLRVQEDDVQLGSEQANRRHSCTQTEKKIVEHFGKIKIPLLGEYKVRRIAADPAS